MEEEAGEEIFEEAGNAEDITETLGEAGIAEDITCTAVIMSKFSVDTISSRVLSLAVAALLLLPLATSRPKMHDAANESQSVRKREGSDDDMLVKQSERHPMSVIARDTSLEKRSTGNDG